MRKSIHISLDSGNPEYRDAAMVRFNFAASPQMSQIAVAFLVFSSIFNRQSHP